MIEMEPNIIFDKRRLAVYSIIEKFCEECEFDNQFIAELWEGLLLNQTLYDEFIFYLQHYEFTGTFACEGYTIPDLYFYHLREFNLYHDTGKNTESCNKDKLVLTAFHTMGRLLKDPEVYKAKLSEPMGMDS